MLAALQYDRTSILNGEVWRLFTAHLVHWNHNHLVWDFLVFLACGGFLEWLSRKSLLLVLFGAALTVSVSLFIFQPVMEYYRGLSAIDMALFTATCIHAIRYCRLRNHKILSMLWSLTLVGCLLKPMIEFAIGDALFAGGFGVGIEASPAARPPMSLGYCQ
jgi:rhomboid family GlyGly-CTERM serine protease